MTVTTVAAIVTTVTTLRCPSRKITNPQSWRQRLFERFLLFIAVAVAVFVVIVVVIVVVVIVAVDVDVDVVATAFVAVISIGGGHWR